MATTNVRVNDEVITALKLTADCLNISLQALVDDVLGREAQFGSFHSSRPVALPPRLLTVADAEFQAAKVKGAAWPVVYSESNGALVLVVGDVRAVGTMSLTLEIWGANRTMAIPRARILAWEGVLGSNVAGEILKWALYYRAYGVVLHPLVYIPNRDDHGV